jgi:hypothetical protein
VVKSDCRGSTLQDLMPSGMPGVNGPGVAEQDARYKGDSEISEDWGGINCFWLLVFGKEILVVREHCSMF